MRADDVQCWACLDFGHLEDLGPCPWCRPDAETEHVLALAEELHATITDETGERA